MTRALQQQSVHRFDGVPLIYNGGPVMQSTSVTYAIFWEPPTLQNGAASHVSPTYNSLIQRYFNDIGGSGVYGNDTQYYDNTGHILNSSTLGGVYVDTSPYPASGCSDSATADGCLIDTQIQAEVTKAMSANHWTSGLTHMFFVFTSSDEGSCFDASSTSCAFTQYCAYHSFFNDTSSQSILYANMPYTGTMLNACGVGVSPNNDFDADSTISVISHEHMETVTDPLLNAWYDNQGYEIGDKCAWNFGTPGLDNGTANVQWNNDFYLVQQEWSNAASGCTLSAPSTQQLSVLYVGSNDGSIYAINASDGTKLWQVQTGGAVKSSPVIVNHIVYVGSLDGNLYALNASTGHKLWSVKVGQGVTSSPVVANKMVYVTSTNGILSVLDARSGRPRWHTFVRKATYSSPAVSNNTVYVGASNGFFYALDANSGRTSWFFQVRNASFTTPAIVGNTVYVGASNHHIYALTANKRGKVTTLWSFVASAALVATPNVTANVLYIGASDGSFYALDTTHKGAKLWGFLALDAIVSQAAVASGVVYVGSLDHTLYALDTTNSGVVLWSYLTQNKILSSPAVANGNVYFGSDDQNLYAINASDSLLTWHFQANGAIESSPVFVGA